VVGATALGLVAVWFVEFFFRSGVQREEQPHPIINIAYPPALAVDPASPLLGPAAAPALTSSAMRLPDAPVPRFPRELSAPEVRALWAAAMPDARVMIAGLLGGLSLEEIAGLRYEHVDEGAGSVRLQGGVGRSFTLRDPLRRLLDERRTARNGSGPFVDERGAPLSGADLEGLLTCAACDAGLSDAAEVTSEALSPPGPGLPLEDVDPVFPALRAV
jgi:integrase